MPEACEAAQRGNAVDAHGPRLGHGRVHAPAAAIAVLLGARAFERGIGARPDARLQRGAPERLRLRPLYREAAEALELAAVAAVEQRVIVESGGRQYEEASGALLGDAMRWARARLTVAHDCECSR